jgi:hypothetical protein
MWENAKQSYSTRMIIQHSKVLWKYGDGAKDGTIFILKVTPNTIRPGAL